MKIYPALFLFALFFSFCEPERAPDPVSSPANYLETGCYYITEDSTSFRRQSHGDNIFYYLDPTPIFSVKQFKEVSMTNRGGYLVCIQLNEAGGKVFSEVTKNSIGKHLAFIVDDALIMTPKVNGKIEGGALQIDGGYTEDEMLEAYRKIKSSMDKYSESK